MYYLSVCVLQYLGDKSEYFSTGDTCVVLVVAPSTTIKTSNRHIEKHHYIDCVLWMVSY